MNTRGSGIVHYDIIETDEMRLWAGGLREGGRALKIDRLNDEKSHHDRLSYNRGTISHSRSPTTMYMNFHYLYGGPKKFFIDRFLYQSVYKRIIRVIWFPATVTFSRLFISSGHHHEDVRQRSLWLLLLLRLSCGFGGLKFASAL